MTERILAVICGDNWDFGRVKLALCLRCSVTTGLGQPSWRGCSMRLCQQSVLLPDRALRRFGAIGNCLFGYFTAVKEKCFLIVYFVVNTSINQAIFFISQ